MSADVSTATDIQARPTPAPVKPNLMDRVVNYFDPIRGAKRLQVRNYVGQIYEAANYSPQRSWLPIQPFDQKRTATTYTRLTLLSYARYLYANLGWCTGLVNDLVRYSVGPRGLRPESLSQDEKWGGLAADYFNEWSKIADDTGRFSFGDLQRMAVRCTVVDGDCGLVLTKTAGGFPKLRFVEGHQIKDDGRTPAIDGVIIDGYNTPEGYRVLVPSDTGYLSAETIAVANFIHFYEPFRFTGTRGISWLAHAINNGRDVFDLIGYEKHFLHNACSTTLLESNDTGTANRASSWINDRPVVITPDVPNPASPGADQKLESLESGGIRYHRAKAGHKLEAFQFERPTASFRDFLDYLEGDGYIGCGMPHSWKTLYKEGGATLRAAFTKAQRRFDEVEALVADRICDRTWNWVTAVGAKRGDLPPRPKDAHKVQWHGPGKATVDMGREAIANRDDIEVGLRTYQEDYGERGLDAKEQLRKVAEFRKFAKELAAQNGLTVEELLGYPTKPAASIPGEEKITV